jgi:predicted MFS family arabinose efflux permease
MDSVALTTRGTPRRARSATAVALGLATGPVVALGFTRFAYALLLPPMREDLSWNYAAAGGMNTANALGYVLGAATAAWWARRFGGARTFVVSMAVSTAALLGSGLTSAYPALAALRAVGGLATAILFVTGSVLATRIDVGDRPHRSALLVAVYMAGVGAGVVIAGIAVPISLTVLGEQGWRAGWVVMGVLALLLIPTAALAARRVPDPAAPAQASRQPLGLRTLSVTVAWYVLFGAGYVSYMTFVVALLRAHGLSVWTTAGFFMLLGTASAVATLLIWGRVIARLRGGHSTALVSLVVLLGVLPVLLWPSLGGALVSAVVFGASFMAGPTAATVLARRALPPHGWAAGIALLTAAFSLGQAIGPLVAGILSDSPSGISAGLWLSVGLLAVSGVVALFQRDRQSAAPPSPISSVADPRSPGRPTLPQESR